jgi:NADP-reducing hydrogenase subunit HndB
VLIKSLDELRKIRQESFEKVALRKHGQIAGEKIEVLVGTSTGENDSRARETFNARVDDVAKEGLEKNRRQQYGQSSK